jgi:hypothetical protein
VPIIQPLKRLRQEDCKCKSSLDYRVRSCLRKPNQKRRISRGRRKRRKKKSAF